MVREWFAALPTIDAVFYAAGIAISGELTRRPDVDGIREAFETNVVGVIHVAEAASSGLRASGGRFVILNSAFSLVTAHGYGGYSASKAALGRIGDALRPELRPATVTDCLLGGVRTDIFRTAATRNPSRAAEEVSRRFGARVARRDSPEVATDILSAAARRKARPGIGTDARLVGFLHRAVPVGLQSAVTRMIGPYPLSRP